MTQRYIIVWSFHQLSNFFKTKKKQNFKNLKNLDFLTPRLPSDSPNWAKINCLMNFQKFQNRQKSRDESRPYMAGWVGYWHPQAQRHSLPRKFSDRPKKPKKSKISKSSKIAFLSKIWASGRFWWFLARRNARSEINFKKKKNCIWLGGRADP